jgi:hypothetical protein
VIWEGKDKHGANMWMEVVVGWREVPHRYATSSQFRGLDPFGRVVKPKQRLGTSVTHFVSSWTGMTQHHNNTRNVPTSDAKRAFLVIKSD